jgi:cytoskeleton protein RodZ
MTKVTHLTRDEGGGLSRRRIHLREISGDADSPLETVGQDLRAARLRRGDDLATVSRYLKIRKDHLEALEEDKFELLPGRTYAVGFVRAYSDYLGLDSVQCVERFKAEIAGRGESTPAIAMALDTDEGRLPHGWVVIAVVVLGLIGYGAYHLAMSADTMLRAPLTSAPARVAPKPVMHVQPQAAARPAATILKPATAVPSVPLTQTPPAITPPASSQASQTPTAILAALPKGEIFGQFNQNPRVVLRIRQTAKVLVQDSSGKVYINRTLKPGDSYRVPDMVGLTLSTPNGGAVGIELDGQAMGFAGKDGKMTEAMSLDPQAVFDRFNNSD